MSRVELIRPHGSDDPEVQAFAERVSRPDGSVGAHFRAESHLPEVMVPIYDARLAIARQGDLGNRLFTKLAVAISMANDCAYCVGAYSTQLSGQLGSHEAVRDYQRSIRDGTLDDRESAIVSFAVALNDEPHGLDDNAFEALRDDQGFTDRTLVELVYIVNIVSGYNRLTVAFDLEYDHEYPKAWAAAAAEMAVG